MLPDFQDTWMRAVERKTTKTGDPQLVDAPTQSLTQSDSDQVPKAGAELLQLGGAQARERGIGDFGVNIHHRSTSAAPSTQSTP